MLLHQALSLSALSLRARLAVALICFELYVEKRDLSWPELSQFIESMWELPCVSNFVTWDKTDLPLLRYVGLGDPIEKDFPEFTRYLNEKGVSTSEVSELIQCTTEIIYSSAYGATDDSGSQKFVEKIVDVCMQWGARLPPLGIFSISAFSENDGWSTPISTGQRDEWRNSIRTAS